MIFPSRDDSQIHALFQSCAAGDKAEAVVYAALESAFGQDPNVAVFSSVHLLPGGGGEHDFVVVFSTSGAVVIEVKAPILCPVIGEQRGAAWQQRMPSSVWRDFGGISPSSQTHDGIRELEARARDIGLSAAPALCQLVVLPNTRQDILPAEAQTVLAPRSNCRNLRLFSSFALALGDDIPTLGQGVKNLATHWTKQKHKDTANAVKFFKELTNPNGRFSLLDCLALDPRNSGIPTSQPEPAPILPPMVRDHCSHGVPGFSHHGKGNRTARPGL